MNSKLERARLQHIFRSAGRSSIKMKTRINFFTDGEERIQCNNSQSHLISYIHCQ